MDEFLAAVRQCDQDRDGSGDGKQRGGGGGSGQGKAINYDPGPGDLPSIGVDTIVCAVGDDLCCHIGLP